MKRSLVLSAGLFLASATPAHAAESVSLASSSAKVRYRGHVTLAGAVMWFAPGFHARWPHGATVRIFP